MRKGLTQTSGTSTFTGYVGDVANFEDVNKAYEYVRYMNMSARHIICACIVPGNTVVDSVDYCDCDEHGTGQKLLEYMESAELENRAIFVVCHYDGQHIGQQRFDLIISAAKSAVNQKPLNDITGKYRFSWETKTHKKKQYKKQSKTSGDNSNSDIEDTEIAFRNGSNQDWAELTSTLQHAVRKTIDHDHEVETSSHNNTAFPPPTSSGTSVGQPMV